MDSHLTVRTPQLRQTDQVDLASAISRWTETT